MAMFLYNSTYKLPALYIIPNSNYNYAYITLSEDGTYAILTLVTEKGFFYQEKGSSNYIYAVSLPSENTQPVFFDTQAFIVACGKSNLELVREKYHNQDITYYSWTRMWYKPNTFFMPTEGQVIWSNVTFYDDKNAIFIEGTKPSKIPRKKIDFKQFLSGYIAEFLTKSSFSFNKYWGLLKQYPTINQENYPYLVLFSLFSPYERIGVLIATDVPLKSLSNILCASEVTKALVGFCGDGKWLELQDAAPNTNNFFYSTVYETFNSFIPIDNIIWSNYDIKNEVDQIMIKKGKYPNFC